MKKIFFVLLLISVPSFLVSETALAWKARKPKEIVEPNSVLIKRIVFSGFVLKDKDFLNGIIKKNRNKYLSQEQIQKIVDQVKISYLEAGYTGLVSVSYKLNKNQLIINILMLNR